jgi:NAD+ kinase
MGVVLLVTKTPLAQRLAREDRERLTEGGVLDPERLAASESRQAETLLAVREALHGLEVRERRIDTVSLADAADTALVVTVGGDGTVFTANTVATSAPFLTVNSDPERSVGHFTRFTAATVAAAITAWREGRTDCEELPRLAINVAGKQHCILNDCLFTHTNPAVLCRYVLESDGAREFQRSSGVWVATASGSTAAYRSAGGEPVAGYLPALLFRVREPFAGRDPMTLLEGRQMPPRGLQLTPAIPGMALYLDGPNRTVPVAPGLTVGIHAAAEPLRLVRLKS